MEEKYLIEQGAQPVVRPETAAGSVALRNAVGNALEQQGSAADLNTRDEDCALDELTNLSPTGLARNESSVATII